MKILRIQGKNLASIAGEFDIDFTAAPLRSAGIFAICGPTGAGKSTILDAICLALFNNMPRTTGIEGRSSSNTPQRYCRSDGCCRIYCCRRKKLSLGMAGMASQ